MDDAREQAIRERAYQLWESKGRPEGQEGEFWRRAEQELSADEPPGSEAEEAAPLAELAEKVGEHDLQSMGNELP